MVERPLSFDSPSLAHPLPTCKTRTRRRTRERRKSQIVFCKEKRSALLPQPPIEAAAAQEPKRSCTPPPPPEVCVCGGGGLKKKRVWGIGDRSCVCAPNPLSLSAVSSPLRLPPSSTMVVVGAKTMVLMPPARNTHTQTHAHSQRQRVGVGVGGARECVCVCVRGGACALARPTRALSCTRSACGGLRRRSDAPAGKEAVAARE